MRAVCVNEEGCGTEEGLRHLHENKGRNKQECDADRFFFSGVGFRESRHKEEWKKTRLVSVVFH